MRLASGVALVLGSAAVVLFLLQGSALAAGWLPKTVQQPRLTQAGRRDAPAAAPPPPPRPPPSAEATASECAANLCSTACHRGALPPAPALLVLTFGSSSMSDFVENWVAHVRRIPALSASHVVLALDAPVYDFCISKGIPVLPAASLTSRTTAKTASTYVFWNRPAFRALVLDKVKLYYRLLECGYSLLATDADTVWLRDPFFFVGPSLRPNGTAAAEQDGGGGGGGGGGSTGGGGLALDAVLELHSADVMVSIDENFIKKEADADLATRDFNTGMLFLRSTPATVAFVAEWAHRIESSDADWCDDQSEFNRLLRGIYPTPRATYSHKPGAPAEHKVHGFEVWPYVPVSAAAKAGLTPRMPPAAGNATAAPVPQLDLEAARKALGGSKPILDALKLSLASGRRPSYWMWNGRIRLATLPLAHFSGGHLFFGERVPQTLGITPCVVHATFQFGDSPTYATGKRQRMRESNLWRVGPPSYFESGDYLRVTEIDAELQRALDVANDEPRVWACKDEADRRAQPTITRELGVCYHPSARLPANAPGGGPRVAISRSLGDKDPALPHIRTQLALRRVLRNAFALGQATGRAVILPHFWCFCMRHWWYLKDCAAHWHDLSQRPLPFRCPMDHNFDVFDLINAGLEFREPQFLSSPRVPWAVRDSVASLTLSHVGADGPRRRGAEVPTAGAGAGAGAAAAAGGGGGNRSTKPLLLWAQAGTVIERPLCLAVDQAPQSASGSREAVSRCAAHGGRPRVDDVALAMRATPLRETRVLEVDAASLSALSDCGFYSKEANVAFTRKMEMAFQGRLQWCAAERNEGTKDIEAWAKSHGKDGYMETVRRFNCTGTDSIEHPSVNLRPPKFEHRGQKDDRCSS